MRIAGIPVNFVNAAASVGAAIDAMVAGSEQIASAAGQIPTFSRPAQRFGFVPFTSQRPNLGDRPTVGTPS